MKMKILNNPLKYFSFDSIKQNKNNNYLLSVLKKVI